MKIGPLDIRVHALVYLGAIFLLVIVMLMLWRSNSVGRLETVYRSSIMQALIEDPNNKPFLEDGAEACRTLIKASPEKASARLYLGTILLREGKAAEAMTVFNEIEKMNTASPDEKIMAELCAGVAQFRAVCGDETAKYAEAAAKCEPMFQTIVSKNSGNADALVNLALAKALQNPKSLDEVKVLVDQAAAAKSLPTLEALEQSYCLRALIAYNQGKPLETMTAYQRAQALQPTVASLGDYQRCALLATVIKPDLTVAVRVKAITDLQREQPKFQQKQFPAVLNAMGYSRALLKAEPDFVKLHYEVARGNFTLARTLDTKFVAAYRNHAAMMEDRIQELASTLTSSLTGINGETPQPNLWTGEQKVSIPQPDLVVASQIGAILREEETLWDLYCGQAAQTPEEKVDGRLRQLSCARRIAWCMPGDSGQSMMPKILSLAKDLIAIGPNDPNAHYAYGQVLLDKGDRTGAFKEFETARTLGLNSQACNRLIAALSGKAELVDVHPSAGLRVFGSKALFRGTVRGVDANNIKEFSMLLDGRSVNAVRNGSQILYVPQDAELTDGKHTVKISVVPADGEAKTMEAEFFINKKPPSWTVTPSGPDMIATQPVWTIVLEDLAGIDKPSLKIMLKKTGGGFSKALVKDGKYQVNTDTGKVGTLVADPASFKVTSGVDITAGEYTLEINVQNLAGIPLSDTKKFNIK